MEDGAVTMPPEKRHSPKSDVPFYAGMLALGGMYLLLVVALLVADFGFVAFRMSPTRMWEIFAEPAVRASISLTLITCTLSALLSLIVAIPIGYLMSRTKFPGKGFVDAVLDVPIVLPPLVIGLSLLILFNQFGLESFFHGLFQPLMPEGVKAGVTYKVPAVVLAQFTVACAFAVRTMRVTFDDIDPRTEHVALTLGCNRSQAFWAVVLPQAWRGALAAFGLAWARSMGEFGSILVFAGAMEYPDGGAFDDGVFGYQRGQRGGCGDGVTTDGVDRPFGDHGDPSQLAECRWEADSDVPKVGARRRLGGGVEVGPIHLGAFISPNFLLQNTYMAI